MQNIIIDKCKEVSERTDASFALEKGEFLMSSEFKVHTIKEEVVIEANHNPSGTVKYHVCYGDVDWERSGTNLRPAVFILMSYNGRKSYTTPAHLTLDSEGMTDFEKVYEALTYLRIKYLVKKKYEVEVHPAAVTMK